MAEYIVEKVNDRTVKISKTVDENKTLDDLYAEKAKYERDVASIQSHADEDIARITIKLEAVQAQIDEALELEIMTQEEWLEAQPKPEPDPEEEET